MLKKGIVALASIILCLLALTTACSQSKQQAKNGDMVNVEYTGKLQNGTVFDSSRDSGQLEFTLGQGSVIPGFEQAVIGMEIGETKTITIPVDLAYGQRQDDMVQVVPREMLGDLEPEVGMQLGSTSIDGQTVIVTVTDVSEETITIDANPPLAGQDLNFEIKLVAIKASSGQTSGSASQPSAIYTKPLAQALASGRPTLAELGSSTCIPCKQMKPILEKLAVDNRDKLNVINIDVYDQPDLARQHKVISIPTQVVFDSSGKEVSRHIGVWPREQIDAELRKLGIN